MPKVILPYGESMFKTTYDNYRLNAKARNIDFDIDRESFRELITKNCTYCGAEPFNVMGKGRRSNGNFIYTGLDRVDNTVGYTLENCVPCCKICNKAKQTMTVEEFLTWIRKVYEHNSI